MKIVFVSWSLNHHQLPFSEALIDNGVDYKFIATEPITEERRNLNYEDMNELYDFVVKAYESEENYKYSLKLIREADVVIVAGDRTKFTKHRMKDGKLTFVYSERIYKEKVKKYKLLIHFFRFAKRKFHKKNVYLLSASAFAAADFAKSFTFLNKAYKWGYFPEVKRYDNIFDLINSKQNNSLLWVGRLIDWKHAEASIEVASRLRGVGYDFLLNIIGNGPLEEQLQELIKEKKLTDRVKLLGAVSPEQVREYMEQSEIFLFTSDRHEGWGAVLNESMNSGCAVVASSAIGSVPFLINDNENGLIYEDGNFDDLYNKVKYLIKNPIEREKIGLAAYNTLNDQWNAKNAVERLLKLSQTIIDGDYQPDIFNDGVCSKSPIFIDDWYGETK